MDDFLNDFCDLLDDTDQGTVNGETKFKDLDEWSSLVALSLIAMIDENYDVTVGAEEIRSADTIADLYKMIQSKNEL